MTQLEYARKNKITPLMKTVSSQEGVSADFILKQIKAGKVVIPANNQHILKKPCGIGFGLKTKINANIGTSTDHPDYRKELNKLKVCLEYGADAVMDLSVGPDIKGMRKQIIRKSFIPVGTVPIYEISVNAHEQKKGFLKFDIDDICRVLESQAKDGVDFFTIHAGVTKKSLSALMSQKRVMGIVSRGGAIIARWIYENNKENPFYEYFDRILEIAHKYDVTLSLGDGLRPGSVLDATDKGQICELKILGELALRAQKRGVQVMIEGPGHVPLNQIEKNIILQKKFCHNAPFYVLGPLVTDVAPGYDHITGAIGGALAASFGADFLCYVTPSEHLRHPSVDDVKEGIIASRIAAHAADIVKFGKKAIAWDRKISEARSKRDWQKQIEFSLDPKKARQYRNSSKPKLSDVCTMCGKFCSIKLMESCVKK